MKIEKNLKWTIILHGVLKWLVFIVYFHVIRLLIEHIWFKLLQWNASEHFIPEYNAKLVLRTNIVTHECMAYGSNQVSSAMFDA